MIKIDLNLFATLSRYLPENAERYEVMENITIEALILDLKIPLELVKLIFINGKRQEISYQIKEGDRVGLFPPIGGG